MTVIEQPKNARSRRTRDALLAAARSLIEGDGLEALTMAAAAERAGVTRRAVYLHFASRTDLVTGLFEYVNRTEDLAASTRPVWEAPDAATALDEWARHLARYHPRLAPIGRALSRARDDDPDAAAHWDLVMADWHTHCLRLTGWLGEEGRLAEPWTVRTAADMLWALMSFDVSDGLLTRGWSEEELARRLAALFRSTFVRR